MGKGLDRVRDIYMDGIAGGNARAAVLRNTGHRYTQHSTGVGDGAEGFLAFFEPFVARNPKRDIEIVRGLLDGQYVFVHAYQSLNDGEAEWVTTDFFDTDENDKIIEHWDVIAAYADKTPSGHTSVDGATEVTDLDKTEANKQLVRDFIQDVLVGDNPANVDKYISSETYIQHNPEVGDGLEPLKALVLAPDRKLFYQEIFLLVGQGNFVATLSKATWDGSPLAQVDIFRVENGLIVEHWDNSEPVPPKEEWVNGGKF